LRFGLRHSHTIHDEEKKLKKSKRNIEKKKLKEDENSGKKINSGENEQ